MMRKLVILTVLLLAVPIFATVSDGETIRESFTTGPSITTFTFTFKCNSSDDVFVYSPVILTGLPIAPLVEDTDYTIAPTGGSYLNGGVVTIDPALADTVALRIVRRIKQSQETSAGAITPATIVAALDKLTRQVQDAEDRRGRSLRIPESDSVAFDMTLPNAIDRAGKVPVFDEDGNIGVTTGTDTFTVVNGVYETITTADIVTKSPWADIRAYGADTASADNAAAIQVAFDSGKSVLIPEGTFIVNSKLNWTTDEATLYFVSHNSIIQASATFPVDTPIIHFAGAEGDAVRNCSVYNLKVRCENRASGILLTHCFRISFYSPWIRNGRNGDDNYAFDISGTHGHTSEIWVYGMTIYGRDSGGSGGGLRMDGDGYNLFRCGFWGAHIWDVGHGIYIKARCHGNYFSQMMIDINYDNAGAFGVKEESGVDNKENVFDTVIVENTYAAGTGIDMQATDSFSTMWNYWIVNFDTASVFYDLISQKYNYRIDGVQLRSRGLILVLHGAFDGYSPDSTMTWGSVRSASVANDSAWDKWDFVLPLSNRAIVRTITNEFFTDDSNADLRMQVWKQNSEQSTWIQVGSDHDFTGDGPHVATIDYTIELNNVVKISILAKRAAGTYLYVLPLKILADF